MEYKTRLDELIRLKGSAEDSTNFANEVISEVEKYYTISEEEKDKARDIANEIFRREFNGPDSWRKEVFEMAKKWAVQQIIPFISGATKTGINTKGPAQLRR